MDSQTAKSIAKSLEGIARSLRKMESKTPTPETSVPLLAEGIKLQPNNVRIDINIDTISSEEDVEKLVENLRERFLRYL